MNTLDSARPFVGAVSVGLAQAALDCAVKYAKERKQFGQPIASFQMIQSMIADMAMKVETARLMVLKACWMRDQGLEFSKEAAMAKCYAADVAMQVTTDAVQVMGGWWWIFIIVLFWMWGGWGGNGFGRGNQAETNSDFARLAAMGNQNNNTDLLMQAINGNKDAINTLSTNLNCDVKSIDNALCSIQNAIGKVGGEVGFSAERVINAVNAGDCNVIKAISDCCCTTQRSIDSVNLNLTQMNADNRLSICQQTNTLQNAITSGFNTLSSENATRFNILGAKIDAQTQIINDKFCQLEMREMQNKIDTLRDEKNALQSSALLQQQTSNIVSQIRPCPVPAYLTCNPYGCNGGLNGYGYGYPYGYGDSCCA